MKRLLITTLAIVLLAQPAWSLVPNMMNIQGVLTDDTGTPLPDGDYRVNFMIWDDPYDGSDFWNDTITVTQESGVFNALLEDLDPQIFNQTLYLSVEREGEAPGFPRIPLATVASAFRAATVDPGAAVKTLNGLTNRVTLVGGANVTVTQVDTTLVIAADGGTGSADSDWDVSGDNIYHNLGDVFIGYPAPGKGEFPELPKREGDDTRNPPASKVLVHGDNEGFVSLLTETNNQYDGRAAIYGRRSRQIQNNGVGYGPDGSNNAITGYNDYGDQYTFGVAGHTYFDYGRTGGVLGSNQTGSIWGSLAYMDETFRYWGAYTPFNLFVGGTAELNGVKIATGANAGYILTSDANGNAGWSAPSATQSDGDWDVSGMNLLHADPGVVAIGTNSAHPLANMPGNTTMQISSLTNPALALDATNGTLTRWSMYLLGGGIQFAKTNNYSLLGTHAMSLDLGKMEVNDLSGDKAIVLQGGDSMESGSKLEVYSTSVYTTLPTVVLDGQDSSSNIGGSLTLRDKYGQNEVVITGSYNGTNVGRVTTPVLEITGGSDLSEQFDLGNTSLLTKPGMVVSIDPANPGRLTLSNEAYDRKVAGVISGAGGVNTGMLMGQRGTAADGEMPVALVGRVYVWADASSGPIEPGDLLTTAERAGHAMKVSDNTLATGAILGKAMTGLAEGQGLILTLISLQ